MYYENFVRLCELKNVKPSHVSKATGISTATLTSWKQGKYTPKNDKLQKIADYFDVSLDFLMTGQETSSAVLSNIYPIELKRFPMLGEIACGEPKYTNEDRESYILAGTNIDADFCLKAKGDSMVNARILDGDIVFIKNQDTVENGEIAAVVVNNDSEATLKRFFYYQEKALLILKPENPVFEDQIYQGEELNQVHVLGKAIAFQSDVR